MAQVNPATVSHPDFVKFWTGQTLAQFSSARLDRHIPAELNRPVLP